MMFWWSDFIAACMGIDRSKSGTNTSWFRDHDTVAERQEAERLKRKNVEAWKKRHPAVIQFVKHARGMSNAERARFINRLAGQTIVHSKRDLCALFNVDDVGSCRASRDDRAM